MPAERRLVRTRHEGAFSGFDNNATAMWIASQSAFWLSKPMLAGLIGVSLRVASSRLVWWLSDQRSGTASWKRGPPRSPSRHGRRLLVHGLFASHQHVHIMRTEQCVDDYHSSTSRPTRSTCAPTGPPGHSSLSTNSTAITSPRVAETRIAGRSGSAPKERPPMSSRQKPLPFSQPPRPSSYGVGTVACREP